MCGSRRRGDPPSRAQIRRSRAELLHARHGPLGLGRSGDGYVGVTRGGDPMVWTILALACIVLAFVGEIIDERILLGTLEWFVAAIAFNTLGALPFVKKR